MHFHDVLLNNKYVVEKYFVSDASLTIYKGENEEEALQQFNLPLGEKVQDYTLYVDGKQKDVRRRG